MNIVLVHPEIPQNTGNIGRLCVCTGSTLHLVEPLGFSLDEKQLRRAGLDYWPHLQLRVHRSFAAFLQDQVPASLLLLTTHAERTVYQHRFSAGDFILLGSESAGLPPELHSHPLACRLRIPMPSEHARSLNLATAAGIVLYESLRQTLFQ